MTKNNTKFVRSAALLSVLALAATACATQPEPTVAQGAACNQLGASGSEALEQFYAPGNIVAATPIKERVFKARANQPIRTMGATLQVRAEPDTNGPYLRRVLSCHAAGAGSDVHPNDPLRPQGGTLTELEVVPSGNGFGIRVLAEDPKVGQEIWQRAESLTQQRDTSVEVEQVSALSPSQSF